MRAPAAPLPPFRHIALLVAAVWLAFAVGSLLMRGTSLSAWPDPDDAMRAVEVRDLIAGQDWHDPHQTRLDPAAGNGTGVAMHWSRLVDAPIAAIIVALTPLVGGQAAEHVALLMWPLIPALLLFPAAGFIGWRIAGRNGAILAVIGTAFSAALVTVYAPGRIDHHNIQIALAVTVIAALTAASARAAPAIVAGLCSGLSLAIGMETLPYLAFGGVSAALTWAFDRESHPYRFSIYAASFLTAAALGMAASGAPDTWLNPVCDTVSAVYLGPLAAAALIGLLPLPRLAAIGIAAIAAVALVWLQNPVCLSGPYAAVDPRLFTEWMDHIREARSAAALIDASPVSFFGIIAVPLLALLAVATVQTTPARIAGVALAIAVALALWQVRTLPFAAVLGAPILAAVAARRFGSGPPALILAGLVSNPLLIVALASMLTFRLFPLTPAMEAARTSTAETACLNRSAYAPLATLPPGLVLGNIAFGPLILAETPHTVLAAPYHRNTAGILDAVAALTGTPAEAEAIIRRRGVSYLALCARSNEMAERRAANPANLFDALKRGERIPWLEQIAVTIDGSMVVYRVLPP